MRHPRLSKSAQAYRLGALALAPCPRRFYLRGGPPEVIPGSPEPPHERKLYAHLACLSYTRWRVDDDRGRALGTRASNVQWRPRRAWGRRAGDRATYTGAHRRGGCG